MAEYEDLPLNSEELSTNFMFTIPVILSNACIAVLACGIGFLISAVLKSVFLRKSGSCEYKSLKRKSKRSQRVLSEWNSLMNDAIEEQLPNDQYLVRRTRSGCAYGVYHIKKPQMLPEIEEFITNC